MATVVYYNGGFLPKESVCVSPDDRGWLLSDGVYEVTASYRGRLFEEERHLRRLTFSLEAIGIRGVDVAGFRSVARELLARNDLANADRASVYIQVTRGAAPRTHAFPDPPVPPTVYALAKSFAPRVAPGQGAKVITHPDIRWLRCDIKSLSLLPNCLASQAAQEANADEAVLVRDGFVTEGTHTSVFVVVDGVLRTAPLGPTILPGVTRAVVLELAEHAGIPAREVAVSEAELRRANEVMLVGTTTEVTGVTAVDGALVGAAGVGPITAELQRLFSERCAQPSD